MSHGKAADKRFLATAENSRPRLGAVAFKADQPSNEPLQVCAVFRNRPVKEAVDQPLHQTPGSPIKTATRILGPQHVKRGIDIQPQSDEGFGDKRSI